MRDTIKNEQYFTAVIERDQLRLESFQTKLANGAIAESRVGAVERTIYQIMRDLWKDKYSLGEPVDKLVLPFEIMLEQYINHWVADWYYDILSCLSIGIMLDIDDKLFFALASKIQESNKQDWLYNFLINYRMPNVTYQETSLLFKRPYQALQDAVSNADNKSEGIKNYLLNKWYQESKDAGWYNTHNNKFDTYTGYWCFEAGAVVKILGLDDTELKNVPYYPYDLVHFIP